jgi:hypothetical protein
MPALHLLLLLRLRLRLRLRLCALRCLYRPYGLRLRCAPTRLAGSSSRLADGAHCGAELARDDRREGRRSVPRELPLCRRVEAQV